MDQLISIVVPAYNHERYVTGALTSVLQQTHPAIELIIIDDCSRDETFRICEEFVNSAEAQKRFVRIELVRHERNQGAHVSLNEGVAAARGRYIAFLNSDDCYMPERLAKCLAACADEDSFVFTGVRPIDDDGDIASDELIGPIRQVLSSRSALPSLSFGFLGRQLAVSTGNIFARLELLRQVGGFVDLRYCHDWDMALRLIALAEPVYVAEELYLYRQHGANSFRSLQNVADAETDRVLRAYFRRVKLGQVVNPLAPTPLSWPGVFELFATRYGVYKFWLMESGAYPKVCRVVHEAADLPRIGG